MRLELADSEIARLYGQGLARGAVVWRKGMEEWRPLLITPELSGLLHRTRIVVSESSPPPAVVDDVTLPRFPRPARLPSGTVASEPAAPLTVATTVAPTAMDVEQPSTPRRRYDLVGVAALSFATAWFSHSALNPSVQAPTERAFAASAVSPPLASPAPPERSPSSSIPTVALADLPLQGEARGMANSASSTRTTTRAAAGAASDGSAPTRRDLVSALTRVANAASGCGERGGPVRVVVTFAKSGVARSIQVSGSALPKPTRSCIIAAAARARVPAFSGDPVTVSKTL